MMSLAYCTHGCSHSFDKMFVAERKTVMGENEMDEFGEVFGVNISGLSIVLQVFEAGSYASL